VASRSGVPAVFLTGRRLVGVVTSLSSHMLEMANRVRYPQASAGAKRLIFQEVGEQGVRFRDGRRTREKLSFRLGKLRWYHRPESILFNIPGPLGAINRQRHTAAASSQALQDAFAQAAEVLAQVLVLLL
jgi:hypothetical protein